MDIYGAYMAIYGAYMGIYGHIWPIYGHIWSRRSLAGIHEKVQSSDDPISNPMIDRTITLTSFAG